MSLNKFMHPRNKYRKPPNFKALAIKYPEFRQFAKQDISGKVCLDFKNLEAVRALTQTLLKEDFSLDVEIPLNRLVPTLPLRLNYLLWIEDVLKCNPSSGPVKGIDIGCGASCVYPLLAAKQFQWHMLATEVDTDSAFIASNNVRRNKLQDMITVRIAKQDIMLEGVLDADTVYDFCMCNPPFFGSEDELDPQNKARTPTRAPPRNAHSGSLSELVVPGGETAFITKIIEDSIKLKELVKVYSVMVGHKTSVAKVKQALREAGVTKVTHTEFCQGHTTRWGVAWSLDSNVMFPQTKKNVPQIKKTLPFTMNSDLSVSETVARLHELMNQLQIMYFTIKNQPELNSMEIKAMMNTWSNSRKKRRQEKLKQMNLKNSECRETVSESMGEENSKTTPVCEENENDPLIDQEKFMDHEDLQLQDGEETKNKNYINDNKSKESEKNSKTTTSVSEGSEKNQSTQKLKGYQEKFKDYEDSKPQNSDETNTENNINGNTINENERNIETTTSESEKDQLTLISQEDKDKFKDDNSKLQNSDDTKTKNDINDDKSCHSEESQTKLQGNIKRSRHKDGECSAPKRVRFEEPFFFGPLVVKKSDSGSVVELCWLRGPGGREAAHQVLQYFKNNFKTN